MRTSTHASLTVNGHVMLQHARIAHSQWSRDAHAHKRTHRSQSMVTLCAQAHAHAHICKDTSTRAQAHAHAHICKDTSTRARTHMQGHKHTRTHRSLSVP